MSATQALRSEIAWLRALHAEAPPHLRNDIAADICDLEQALTVLTRSPTVAKRPQCYTMDTLKLMEA